VRLASGHVEPAELLTAGNAAFAYRAGDRYGVALASPSDASGYRWTESLDSRTRERVAAAFAEASSGADTCRVPMDASGMLRVDDELHGWTFARIWESGGPMMWPLAAVALLALVLVCERVAYLARQGGRSEKVLDRVLDACGRADLDAARAECGRGHGVVVRGLAACLKQAGAGGKAMENGFQEQLLHELPRLERSLSQIGTLAAVAPLLGLLGTVTGIIQTFGVIRVFGNANPGLMAGGIAEALLTTATGLVIAIPVLLSHNLLQARVEALTGYAEQGAATLINRLAPGGET
jgi:biopolymer transport protein ExbB